MRRHRVKARRREFAEILDGRRRFIVLDEPRVRTGDEIMFEEWLDDVMTRSGERWLGRVTVVVSEEGIRPGWQLVGFIGG